MIKNLEKFVDAVLTHNKYIRIHIAPWDFGLAITCEWDLPGKPSYSLATYHRKRSVSFYHDELENDCEWVIKRVLAVHDDSRRPPIGIENLKSKVGNKP